MTTTPQPLTAAALTALPAGTCIRYATERGKRPAVAIKGTGYGPDSDKWHSSDSMAPVTSFLLAQYGATVLQDAPSEPAPLSILGTWLVEDLGGCTCVPYGSSHEPSCGVEPLVDLESLDGWESLRRYFPPTA